MNKKELQIKRNRITAQLSRDRKSLEYSYLMNQVIALRKKVKEGGEGPSFCQKCKGKINIERTELIKVTRVEESVATKELAAINIKSTND